MSIRVALLTYSTKPRGGVVHTLALAEALARAGAQVTVITLGRGGDQAFFRTVDAAVGVLVVPFEPREESVGDRITRSIDELRTGFATHLANGAEFDIVHAEDCITANAVDGVIRTVHHLDTFSTPQLVRCHEAAITGPIELVTVSAAVATEVEAGWGRAATVIPNGVDGAAFAAAAGAGGADARAVWRVELGLAPPARYVLAVGGIEPRKGTLDLLEAFAVLRDRRAERGDEPIGLVIAGGETLFDYGDYRARFDSRAAELSVTPILLGTVPQERMAALVAAASVLPFVSTKEGFGLAAMEALAASVPVVARDLPVLREVFGDAVRYAGTVFDIADELDRVLSGDRLDAQLGRDLAASYSWDTAAARHLELYARVLAARVGVA